jgi:hypothetical protein
MADNSLLFSLQLPASKILQANKLERGVKFRLSVKDLKKLGYRNVQYAQ